MRSDPAAIAAAATSADARELVWREGFPAVDGDGRLEWAPIDQPNLFLGLDEGSPRFSTVPEALGDVRAGLQAVAALGPDDAALFAAALSLASWHRRHGFCANCGEPTEIVRAGWSSRCPSCAAEHFPRVDPVVIMLAEHDGSVLLGRQPQYPPGRYSALAGFVEVGETIEAAVARELAEEAGIAAHSVSYVASQPWPFPSSLMIGCFARAVGRDLRVDKTELDDARWFTREEVAAAVAGEVDAPFLPPPRWAIARTLLDHWLAA